MSQQICTMCGSVGYPKSHVKGSFLIELVLWLLFLIPGLIYTIWRLATKQKVCQTCGSATMIPINSPKGRELFQAQPPPNPSQVASNECPHCRGLIKPGDIICRHCKKTIGAQAVLFVCVLAAALGFASCSKKNEVSKFDGCYRATKELQGAINVGVSYVRFSELMQKFSAEIEIVKDHVDPKDPTQADLAKDYATVFGMYKDSLDLWEMKNEASSDEGGKVFCGYPAEVFKICTSLKQKYGIEIVEEKPSHELTADTSFAQKRSAQRAFYVTNVSRRVNTPSPTCWLSIGMGLHSNH